MSDWEDQGFREFEAQRFKGARFWRAPVKVLHGSDLYAVFEDFARTFPDHPSESNTVFYLVESLNVRPRMLSVLLWCDHFEHTSLEDVRNLTSFIESAAAILSEYQDMAGVEMLDGIQDRVILSFHEPRPSVVELLQSRGVEGAV